MFPDGIFPDWFGEFCVLWGQVAIMVIALYREKTAPRSPGATGLPIDAETARNTLHQGGFPLSPPS